MSVEPKVFEHVRDVLNGFDDKYLNNGKLKRNKIIEDLDAYDEQLMTALLSDQLIHQTYTKKLAGVEIFEVNQFIQMLEFKEYWEDSYTKYSNKIGLTAGGKFIDESEDVVLDFPFKDTVLKAGMSKEDLDKGENADEPFLNEVIAKPEIDELLEPKVFVNAKRYDADGEHEADSFTDTDNLVIKGNNLIALHSIKEKFSNKIDVIYIDPPYNVPSNNNTFTYNNNFNGSSWLVFMKNRLEISKELLNSQNGVMIIAIDENEVNELGVLISEIFSDYEKHLITVVHNPRGIQGTNFSYNNEFLYFVFPKGKKLIGNRKLSDNEISWSNLRNWGGESLRFDGKNTFYPIILNEKGEIIGFGNPCNDNLHPNQTEKVGDKYYVYPIDRNGIERKWRYAYNTVPKVKEMLKAEKKSDGHYEIMIGKTFGQYKTVWQSPLYDSSIHGKQLLKKLVPDAEFSFPKSVYAVRDALYAVVGKRKNAIILDFFSGSGTTAHAVQILNDFDNGNRRFITIEQMDYIKTVQVPRILAKDDNKKISPFIYAELMEKNGGFVRDVEKAANTTELLAVFDRMKNTADFDFRVDLDEFEAELNTFESLADQKHELLRILDKNQLYYNYANIDDANVRDLIADHDYKFNQSFYGNGGEE